MTSGTHELSRVAVTQAQYLWYIPLFPILGAFWNATLGWKMQKLFGKKAVHYVAVGAMMASLGVALFSRTPSGTCSPRAGSGSTSPSRWISCR
jgi:NADH-quinone oxidoreductase subunit L